jgi:hypothetical protein
MSSELIELVESDDIKPGDLVSYGLCKSIYLGHPLGAKMAEEPIRLAQSDKREIKIPGSPEEEVVEAFNQEWKALNAEALILNLATQARVYGIATIVVGEKNDVEEPGNPYDPGKMGEPIDLAKLWDKELYFNVLDPLNTAGSMTTNQDPNSPLFQKWGDVFVQGRRYHRSRTITLMNESPLYISWSPSAFGFVGR